jgi:hypothetical protein
MRKGLKITFSVMALSGVGVLLTEETSLYTFFAVALTYSFVALMLYPLGRMVLYLVRGS